jgi:hypothetical protein
MKAIMVKYFGPTNTRPSRMKATDCDGNSATVSYHHGLVPEDNAKAAARALVEKMGWGGEWVGGSVGRTTVFVHLTGANGARMADGFTVGDIPATPSRLHARPNA